ncbi:hypothetical protein A9G48_04080 [Gilliamella sp. wkB18]|uniref:TIGR03751 family conjugal transfer lipoprotein n=1 Tax=Gilliamella sp. wkB18 TaxID=3120260 RepID=UPI00080E919D|nr:TIGR03751 family conjugal transfer lipoprotein [Gilliamella apicola]OCG64111.1 hypothetical protein A9G48_04080 [Gilliamella apicola]
MKKTHKLAVLLTITAVTLLSGCSTSKDEMFPHSGETMNDIYNKKAGNRFELRRETDDTTQSLEIITHTRTAEKEINNLFQRLPNPDLVMYIYPHLTGDGKLPVPGYSTVFCFYGEVQYAMPGERVERY